MSTRRDFLAQSATAAAAAGLHPSLRAELAAVRHRSARPWLQMAVRCARWIEGSAQSMGETTRWPADPA